MLAPEFTGPPNADELRMLAFGRPIVAVAGLRHLALA